ncbi:MAG TPA: GntR family transcriptional regulator [Oscillibacter sp.]|nr:GntR family transcriptional regulator [Oscillibacter sp.]
MLTYTLEKQKKESLYEQLYRFIREDILSGRLHSGERLPSKRTLAQHLEVSTITVKNAYEQLQAEGYIHARQRCGYFVSEVERPPESRQTARPAQAGREREQGWFLDFASGTMDPAYFPFTVWARLMRQTLLEQDKQLLRAAPYNGAAELRQAIAGYLQQFRGMQVDPEQIIVGAGTELLYHLLIQLLGRDKCYAVEDPGYSKIAAIYESNQVQVQYVGIDEAGLSAAQLRRHLAQVVHISPTHHYPTGTVMPIGRRQELLRWAAEQPERYILEDDYDSEFRFVGRPIPSLYSTDENERVVYLNTFSKTIAPSIRISYMILPPKLLERYREKLGFYACTVSGFEQYTLAKFLEQGYFERHLGRMRNRYRQKRDQVITAFLQGPLAGRVKITGQDAGLHFLAELQTSLPDDVLQHRAAEKGLRLAMLSDYYHDKKGVRQHTLVVNYSGLNLQHLPRALEYLADIIKEGS